MTHNVRAKIDRIATHDPVFCSKGATLADVAGILWQRDVGLLLVGDGRHLVGVISERDVVSALARGLDGDTTTADAVMTTGVVSVRPGDTVHDAVAVMLDLGVRHVPIADERGIVTGIVSLRDALRPLLVDALSAS